MSKPVIKGATNIIVHVPDLIRYGSKPEREIKKDPEKLDMIYKNVRSFEEAVAYPPNQVFIGNLRPNALLEFERPWTDKKVSNAKRSSYWGEIISEEEFYGWLKIADLFNLVLLEQGFLNQKIIKALENHHLISEGDLKHIGSGFSLDEIQKKIEEGIACPLYYKKDQLVGCVQQGHSEDKYQTPEIMLENLSNKASGIIALRKVLKAYGIAPSEIEYVIACDEEAVGDRYQRGGGNMGKSIAAHCGCINASGSDTKAFCCAPAHAVTVASSLVQAGVFKNVAIVGGGSLAKLGMKFAGNLKHNMPITEDQLGAIAIIIGEDDGKSPVVRLDAIGKHNIAAGSSAQAIYQKLIAEPLDRIGMRILDIDKYAVELHNPDITEPNGNGNVPKGNYRIIAAMAVLRGEMDKSEMDEFESKYGMPGFSPTQGHIASAVPFLPHAREMIINGEIKNSMFIGKGSMFLGKMTDLADGMSFIIEKNN